MLAWMFWLFLACALSLVVVKGGRVERWFSVAIALSVACTFLLNRELGWIAAHKMILLIDVALLTLSLVLVSKSRRYWPIWFTAFQAIAVATSVAFFVFPNHVPSLYINAQGFWFFPALMFMTIGVIMDNRKAA
jgi:hypothetical protein